MSKYFSKSYWVFALQEDQKRILEYWLVGFWSWNAPTKTMFVLPSCCFFEFFGKLGTWGRHLIVVSSVKYFNLAFGEPDTGHISSVQQDEVHSVHWSFEVFPYMGLKI